MAGNRINARVQTGGKVFLDFTTSGSNSGITLPDTGEITEIQYRKCRNDHWVLPGPDEYEMEGYIFYGNEGHYKLTLWLGE